MDDQTLRTQFEDLSLAQSAWTHEAHVRVAWIYLTALGFDEALLEVERRIRAYNAHVGVPEGPTQGYNQTTTHALLQIIDTVRRAYGDTFPVADSRAFYARHPQLRTDKLLRCFYSPDRRMHPDAKQRFVEPDLAPLPHLPED